LHPVFFMRFLSRYPTPLSYYYHTSSSYLIFLFDNEIPSPDPLASSLKVTKLFLASDNSSFTYCNLIFICWLSVLNFLTRLSFSWLTSSSKRILNWLDSARCLAGAPDVLRSSLCPDKMSSEVPLAAIDPLAYASFLSNDLF